VLVAAREEFWAEMEQTYADSPIHRTLGLTLRVVAAGEVAIVFDGTPQAGNRRGHPAGGALAEMLDSAVVQAARTLVGPADQLVTLDLKMNFVAAATAGCPLSTRARIDHLGRSTVVGTGRIEDPSGNLIALGIVTVNRRRTVAVGGDSHRRQAETVGGGEISK
jgi:uncharacterized protein (TIGR00369 family)